MEKLGQGEGNLQAWVQSKLTKASDYIDSVADYMDAKDPVVKEAVELSNQVKEYIGEEDYREKASNRNQQLRDIAYSVLKRDPKSGVTTQKFPSVSGKFLEEVGEVLNKNKVNPENHEKAINHPGVIEGIKNAHKEHLELRRREDDYEKEHLKRIESMKKEEIEVQYMVDKEGHKLDGEIIESYEIKSNGRVKVKTASGTGYIKEEDIAEMDLPKPIRNEGNVGRYSRPVDTAIRNLSPGELKRAKNLPRGHYKNWLQREKQTNPKYNIIRSKRRNPDGTNTEPKIFRKKGNAVQQYNPKTGEHEKTLK